MMRNTKSSATEPAGSTENKIRIPVWVYPSTLEAIDRAKEQGNCKSRSEYLDRAALFYAGYISGQDACDYLPPALVSAIRGVIQDTENRICRLLFKLAVEVDMTMNVLAAALEIDKNQLRDLRGSCVRNVKKTSGSISLDDAVERQRDAGHRQDGV